MDSLSSVKQFITQVQGKVRGLDKLIKKEQKILQKSLKEKTAETENHRFCKAGPVSDELCLFMNKKRVHMARTEVTQYIITYIKDKQLVNNDNKKVLFLIQNLEVYLLLQKRMKLLF